MEIINIFCFKWSRMIWRRRFVVKETLPALVSFSMIITFPKAGFPSCLLHICMNYPKVRAARSGSDWKHLTLWAPSIKSGKEAHKSLLSSSQWCLRFTNLSRREKNLPFFPLVWSVWTTWFLAAITLSFFSSGNDASFHKEFDLCTTWVY